ncbi:MAG: DUF1801 domain-containing protein [Thermomicrobiales bacterium]|nr:DUF1801 domain-containing protein [Thermomicrobiales bacterium]
MSKSENKTGPTPVSPYGFIETVEPPIRREEAAHLIEIFREVTGHEPVMWGPSIIGFDSYHYVYESGREGDAPAAGFSPRKPQTVIYLIGGYEGIYPEQLAKLGPYKVGKSCLYIKKLADVDESILRELIADSYRRVKESHAGC